MVKERLTVVIDKGMNADENYAWIDGLTCSFHLSNDDLVRIRPVRHWTDSKIRCHLFTCIVAMTYLRCIELKLAAAGIQRTAVEVMADMRHLQS